MAYRSDLTDERWALLEPVFNAPRKRGRKHAEDLRTVVDAMCVHRSHRVPVALPAGVLRSLDARVVPVPPVVPERHLGTCADRPSRRGASNGGRTFHDRGGPYGRTKGATRVVAVDVTGLPVAALVVPASTHENQASDLVLRHMSDQGAGKRLELVIVDRGVTAVAAGKLGRRHDVEVRRVGWEVTQPVFRPIRHAWRVEVAHARLGRSRRLAKSFENTTTSATGWLQVACVADILRHMSRLTAKPARIASAA